MVNICLLKWLQLSLNTSKLINTSIISHNYLLFILGWTTQNLLSSYLFSLHSIQVNKYQRWSSGYTSITPLDLIILYNFNLLPLDLHLLIHTHIIIILLSVSRCLTFCKVAYTRETVQCFSLWLSYFT